MINIKPKDPVNSVLVADSGRAHQGGRDVHHVRRDGLAEGCGSHPKVAYGEKKVSKTSAVIQ